MPIFTESNQKLLGLFGTKQGYFVKKKVVSLAQQGLQPLRIPNEGKIAE